MKLIVLAALTFGFLFMVSTYPAAAETERANSVFQSIDSNKDGKIVHDEFVKDMKNNSFAKIDADNNGEIDWSEWNIIDSAPDKEKHEQLFKSMDKNGDGKISFTEFSDYAGSHSNIEESFMGVDKNRDNILTPDEITARPLFRMITIGF
jgi:Neuraminidase (sialidase)